MAFPDGTKQTTALIGGGVPPGFMILGETSTAPSGAFKRTHFAAAALTFYRGTPIIESRIKSKEQQMNYVLRVSPKGQVILPKKLRESLHIRELIAVEVKDDTGIVRKAELSSESLAGCFKGYAAKKKISPEKALEKAREVVAGETARKAR